MIIYASKTTECSSSQDCNHLEDTRLRYWDRWWIEVPFRCSSNDNNHLRFQLKWHSSNERSLDNYNCTFPFLLSFWCLIAIFKSLYFYLINFFYFTKRWIMICKWGTESKTYGKCRWCGKEWYLWFLCKWIWFPIPSPIHKAKVARWFTNAEGGGRL